MAVPAADAGESISSTLVTEKTSSNATSFNAVVEVVGRSTVSAEGILGFRPRFRFLDSRPIWLILVARAVKSKEMLRFKAKELQTEGRERKAFQFQQSVTKTSTCFRAFVTRFFKTIVVFQLTTVV